MPLKIRKIDTFDKELAEHKGLLEKFQEFLITKNNNPTEQFGAKDTRFISSGPIGKTGLKLYHAHLSQDVSVIYRIHGTEPNQYLDLYGIKRHKDIGTGNTANIKKQQSAAKQFKKAKLVPDVPVIPEPKKDEE